MFAEACGTAREFARPVIVPGHRDSGSGCGTFIILNRTGWAVTARHIIEGDAGTEQTGLIWGWPGVEAEDIIYDSGTDMAAFRLSPFDPDWISGYPMLSDGSSVRIGRSFGRLGYSAAEDGNPASALPLFNGGIISRIYGPQESSRIITSTAGMKGQSGGPLFDAECCILGMQTSTRSSRLGYSGADESGNMRPLMSNEGIALHADAMRRFLDAAGISYRIRAPENRSLSRLSCILRLNRRCCTIYSWNPAAALLSSRGRRGRRSSTGRLSASSRRRRN